MPEYQPRVKKKIWKDSLSSSEIDTQTTLLLETLDLVLTSKEKDLKPYWTKESKEISERLLLPTKIDYVDSVLNLSKESSENIPMGKSWFSIKKNVLEKKNSSMTSFPLSQFSLPDCMDSEVMESKRKYKTLKIRTFPTKTEIEKISKIEGQFRWYYNAANSICSIEHPNIKKYEKLHGTTFRDSVMCYDYKEEKQNDLIVKSFVKRPKTVEKYKKIKQKKPRVVKEDYIEHTEFGDIKHFKDGPNVILLEKVLTEEHIFPVPLWCESKEIHSRTVRGAIKLYTQSINSALSNLHNGNITDFTMKNKTKVDDRQSILYEDSNYPKFFNNLKSRYTYSIRGKTNKRRRSISFQDILNTTKDSGFTFVHDIYLNRYYIHYSVPVDWFPTEDRRAETQASTKSESYNRVISLDPGVRKFMTGYDGLSISVVGDKADKEILEILYYIDNLNSKIALKPNNKKELQEEKRYLWFKVKNLISELHWKTASFLTKNYDVIILPDFRISGMVTKNNISKSTKRMLYMFSYHSFKEKLLYKCSVSEKKLCIVDESFTSKTCCKCGTLNDVKGSETYKCSKNQCLTIDRDYNGSVGIFIKNVKMPTK